MMPGIPDRSRPQRPAGAEGWIPPLLIAIGNLVLAAALVWFVAVAWTLRGRIAVPVWVIPVAAIAAAALAIRLLLRAWRSARDARAGWRMRSGPARRP